MQFYNLGTRKEKPFPIRVACLVMPNGEGFEAHSNFPRYQQSGIERVPEDPEFEGQVLSPEETRFLRDIYNKDLNVIGKGNTRGVAISHLLLGIERELRVSSSIRGFFQRPLRVINTPLQARDYFTAQDVIENGAKIRETNGVVTKLKGLPVITLIPFSLRK